MRTKEADLVVKVIISVVIVILTGLLVAWMTGLFKDKKQNLNSGTEKIDSTVNSMSEFDLLSYDGDTISGNTLTELIEEVVKQRSEISIAVQTLVNAKKVTPITIYYNKVLSGNELSESGTATALDQSDKSDDNYVTPSATFLGKIIKNKNDEITGIIFIQQK